MIAQDLPCLDVAIIGGGIAGALAARVLREQHNVTIYERSKSASEIGAAINVGPNGVKILDQLGFSRELVGSLTVGRMATYNHHGEALNVALRDFKRDFGADWLFQHRADLHQEFIRLATVDSEELGIAGQPARIHYGATVVQAEPESGSITLADGTDRTFDLLVGEWLFEQTPDEI
jgi:salicylate hydroxylase